MTSWDTYSTDKVSKQAEACFLTVLRLGRYSARAKHMHLKDRGSGQLVRRPASKDTSLIS